MTLDTLEKTMQKLSDQNVSFIWHGGEPLLMGLDFYEHAVQFQHKYNVTSTNCIQTNITLLNTDWIEFIKQNHFEVSTSLDGVKEVHNIGRGESFDRVVYGIKTLRNEGMRVGIVSVISDYSIPYLFENFQLFQTLGVSARVNPQESCHGNVLARSTNIKTYEFAVKFYYDMFLGQDKPYTINIQPACEMFRSLMHGQGIGCTLSMNCVGKFPCVIASGDVNHCGRFIGSGMGYLGNVHDPTFDFDINNNIHIQQLYLLNKERVLKCAHCNFYNICHGGCFYHGWKNNNSKDIHCTAYQNIYKHILMRNQQLGG
jgi:uncharacterized protein